MRPILTRSQLAEFARATGVRSDWHEPDEQDLTARVEGVSFDNAGFWPSMSASDDASPGLELHVIFSETEIDVNGERVATRDLAAVNLATLCAWATGTLPD